jgi:hypothetical protein
MQQLNSNLGVLESTLPVGTIANESTQVLTTGSNANQFALEVDITVGSSSLSNYFGDFIYGLQTGLTGDPSIASVEGLSIIVTDQDGSPLVGSWVATRSATGTIQFADPSQVPSIMQVTSTFVNLTGGPSTLVGAIGNAHGRSGSVALHSAFGNGRSTEGTTPVIWWTVLILIATLFFIWFYLRERRHRV